MAAARLEPAVGVPLRRLDPARPLQGPGARRRERVRSRRRVRGRHDHRERARRDRAARVPDRGLVRGHVHREHDGVDQRGDRHGAARVGVARPPSTAAATTSRTSRVGRSCTCSSSTSGPRQIMTKEAFENAIAVTMALGGSTNAVLHLLAIANEARVELELDDFNRIGARVPHIADMKPHGKYHMVDLDRVGGVPVVMQELLDAGPAARRLPHRHRQDDGREPRRARPARSPTATSCTRSSDPIHTQGGIAVLRGSLAPNGAVVKVAGHRRAALRGHARASSTARTRRWKRSSRARSSPATSS